MHTSTHTRIHYTHILRTSTIFRPTSEYTTFKSIVVVLEVLPELANEKSLSESSNITRLTEWTEIYSFIQYRRRRRRLLYSSLLFSFLMSFLLSYGSVCRSRAQQHFANTHRTFVLKSTIFVRTHKHTHTQQDRPIARALIYIYTEPTDRLLVARVWCKHLKTNPMHT